MKERRESYQGSLTQVYDVSTDDRSVWVHHNAKCLMRFTPDGYDFIPREGKQRRPSSLSLVDQWSAFKAFCQDLCGVELDDSWAPSWLMKKLLGGGHEHMSATNALQIER